MSTDPRALRALAATLRRGADRLTLLRLRLANTVVELTRVEGEAARALGEQLHEHWTLHQHRELGAVASRLRADAKRLEAAALEAERRSGRRLGGYAGAGFLGTGDDARQHLETVAEFVGARQGASIGGYPLQPSAQEQPAAHPSHSLGIDTPVYEDPD